MDPVTMALIGVGVGAAGKLLTGLFDHTASDQSNLMHQKADLDQSALDENMRRTEGQQTQVLSSTKARMAATGFDTGSGSFSNYLSGMSQEFNKQNAYALTSGTKSIDLENQAADVTGNVDLSKIFGAVGTAGSTVGTFGSLLKPGSP